MFLTFKRSDHNISTSCLSILIALQRSNEVYRYIRYPYRRTQQPLNNNFKFTIFCIFYLATNVIVLFVISLILLSGDIHLNPGPDSVNGVSDSMSTTSSNSSFSYLANHLSLVHLSVQSILPTLDNRMRVNSIRHTCLY